MRASEPGMLGMVMLTCDAILKRFMIENRTLQKTSTPFSGAVL